MDATLILNRLRLNTRFLYLLCYNVFKKAEHIVGFVNTEDSLAITSNGYAYFYFVLFFQFLNFSLSNLKNERWNMEQLFRAISTNFSHGIALIYPVSRRIAWISAHPEISPTQNRAVSICSKLVGNLTKGFYAKIQLFYGSHTSVRITLDPFSTHVKVIFRP